MPSPRWLPVLALAVFLGGCKDRALQQRADEIRDFSNKENRAFTADAISHIQRKYWTLREGAWFGRLPDGTIVRLEAPHATAAPLPSSAFFRGWHLQLTISSEDWRTYPPSDHREPFAAIYAITRHSATNWDIRETNGHVTSPLHREDAARVEAGL